MPTTASHGYFPAPDRSRSQAVAGGREEGEGSPDARPAVTWAGHLISPLYCTPLGAGAAVQHGSSSVPQFQESVGRLGVIAAGRVQCAHDI
jgi:hypothetical protein